MNYRIRSLLALGLCSGLSCGRGSASHPAEPPVDTAMAGGPAAGGINSGANGGAEAAAGASGTDAGLGGALPSSTFAGRLTDTQLTANLLLSLDGAVVPPELLTETVGRSGEPGKLVYKVYDGKAPGQGGESLLLDVRVTDGQWETRASGFAKGYNLTVHRAELKSTALGGDTLSLALKLSLSEDEFAAAGEANVDISLTQGAGTDLSGSFNGTFNGAAVAGNVRGAIGQHWPLKVASFQPPASGEHPRLLFRRDDLAELKRRASTPQGQQVVARMRERIADAAGLLPDGSNASDIFDWGAPAVPYEEGAWAVASAFLYQLFDDPQDCEDARKFTTVAITERGGEWGGWGNSCRRFDAALAYDLCHDAWDPSFKQQVAGFLADASSKKNKHRPDAPMDMTFAPADAASSLAILGDPEDTPESAARLNDALEDMRWMLELSISEHGFTNELVNWTDSLYLLIPFAHVLRTAAGLDVTSRNGLGRFIPHALQTSQMFLRNDWDVQSWWATYGFTGQVDDTYRAVLRSQLDAQLKRPQSGLHLPLHGVYFLLNYPFDQPAQTPADAALPLTELDHRFGAYATRTGWSAADFSSALQLRRDAVRVSTTAGDFQVARGGQQLAGMRMSGGGYYVAPNYPRLVDDAWSETIFIANGPRLQGALPVGGATPTYAAAGSDGTLVVSATFDHYIEGETWWEDYSSVNHHAYRHEISKPPVDLGSQVTQSIAFDHSQASGAPLVVAAAYRFASAGRKSTVVLNLAGKGVIEGNSARFTVPGADQGAIVVSAFGATPPSLALPGISNDSGTVLELSAGGEEYFVVIVFTSAEASAAPAVTATGTGLSAQLSVGAQAYTFDGEKIVLASGNPLPAP